MQLKYEKAGRHIQKNVQNNHLDYRRKYALSEFIYLVDL